MTDELADDPKATYAPMLDEEDAMRTRTREEDSEASAERAAPHESDHREPSREEAGDSD